MKKLREKFHQKSEKINRIRNSHKEITSYSACTGIITFATMKSKHRYLEAYAEAQKSKDAFPDKFRLLGKPLEFQYAGDTRDLNYRFADSLKPRKSKCLIFSLFLLLLCIIASALVICISFITSISTPMDCSDLTRDQITALSSTSPECNCAYNGLFSNISE